MISWYHSTFTARNRLSSTRTIQDDRKLIYCNELYLIITNHVSLAICKNEPDFVGSNGIAADVTDGVDAPSRRHRDVPRRCFTPATGVVFQGLAFTSLQLPNNSFTATLTRYLRSISPCHPPGRASKTLSTPVITSRFGQTSADHCRSTAAKRS